MDDWIMANWSTWFSYFCAFYSNIEKLRKCVDVINMIRCCGEILIFSMHFYDII